MEKNNIIWKPQAKQATFMRRKEFEVLYGGAAGGGKSDALVIEALRQVHIPHYKALILRKTFPQLRELIDKSLIYYPQAFPGARYNSSSHTWKFPSGARVIFGSMNRPTDKIQYQGQAFDVIMFDELTHFTFDEYIYLHSRCRPNGPGTQCYIRCTCNPGGIGHAWVKDRFIDPAPPMTPIEDVSTWTDPNGEEFSAVRHRIFVPSTVFDNEELLRNDPSYIERLAALPEAEKKALLYGDWDSFSGQVFHIDDDPQHYEDGRWTHVIEPFKIPADWKIVCGLDWGYAKPFAVGWFAVANSRHKHGNSPIYMIAEYYGCTGTPNEGIKAEPTEVAQKIREIEETNPDLKGRQITRVGDPAIWGKQAGSSIGELFERERIYFERGINDRLNGKMQLHYRLAYDDDGYPMFQVFNTCRHWIRTIPSLVYDERYVEDVDSDGEDHLYDMTKYVLMRNPIVPPMKPAKKPKPYNPLDTDMETEHMDRYEFYRKY